MNLRLLLVVSSSVAIAGCAQSNVGTDKGGQEEAEQPTPYHELMIWDETLMPVEFWDKIQDIGPDHRRRTLQEKEYVVSSELAKLKLNGEGGESRLLILQKRSMLCYLMGSFLERDNKTVQAAEYYRLAFNQMKESKPNDKVMLGSIANAYGHALERNGKSLAASEWLAKAKELLDPAKSGPINSIDTSHETKF